MTVKVSYLQPYKVRTFTTCLAFPPWCSRYTVHNKVAYRTEVRLHSPKMTGPDLFTALEALNVDHLAAEVGYRTPNE